MKVQFPEYLYSAKGYKPGKKSADNADLIYLSSNENNWCPSPKALAEIQKNLQMLNRYPDASAQTLRNHLAYHFNIDAESIICGNGSDDILYTLCALYFRKKGKLLTSASTFISIPVFSGLLNFNLQQISLQPDYTIDLNGILNAIDDQTSMIYIANPNNPTGHLLSADSIEYFVKQIPAHILIVLDEAYYEYAVATEPAYEKLDLTAYPNVLRLRSFSKAYGLAGIRLGYGMGNPEICKLLQKGRPAFTPSLIAQAAGIGALQDQEFVQNIVYHNCRELNRYALFFRHTSLKYIPSSANFITPIFSNKERALKMFRRLKESGILVRPLESFALSHALRISMGKPDENIQCIEAMEKIINSTTREIVKT